MELSYPSETFVLTIRTASDSRIQLSLTITVVKTTNLTNVINHKISKHPPLELNAKKKIESRILGVGI